jgi:hypothetical protein
MKHRCIFYCPTILSAALLCMTLIGCSKQSAQQQQQPATEGTPEQTASPATETAQPVAEADKSAENSNNFSGYANKFPAAAGTAAAGNKTAAESIAPKPAPRTITLAEGTPIQVLTINTLSTKTVQTRDEFEASLDQAIVEGKWTIAKRGATVKGIITESDPGGRVKGVASMSLKLTSLTLADGREVSIGTNTYTVEAKTTKKKDATKIGIGAGIGAAIGAIAGGGKGAAIGAGVGGAAGTGTVLATRGDPAVISSETPITFELTSPLKVTEKK